ncbi:MAG TPA: helix-hairpin-helix domain-containing protein [Pseudonocardiaceae bacterium]|jgi:competence protein ComEA|nr:helix-hairpin-helix domain-containing protein [Pseudonocardiaceae bacterium]
MNQPRRTSKNGYSDARDQLAMLVGQLAPQAAGQRQHSEPAEEAGSTTEPKQSIPDTKSWSDSRTERLVERWLPGGTSAVKGARTHLGKHRLTVIIVLIVAAIATAVILLSQSPTTEPAPLLPAAISAAPAAATTEAAATTTNEHIVVSVVGKVLNPGLVTLTTGARVADAVTAAGGVPPGTDLITLNMARRLSDGEQIYVGIPVPPDASADQPDPGQPDDPGTPITKGGKGKKPSADGIGSPGQVNLNNANLDELETLPGIGPALAQRILDWRTQHGSFGSVDQLRDVTGIGDAKFAKLKDLVTA